MYKYENCHVSLAYPSIYVGTTFSLNIMVQNCQVYMIARNRFSYMIVCGIQLYMLARRTYMLARHSFLYVFARYSIYVSGGAPLNNMLVILKTSINTLLGALS